MPSKKQGRKPQPAQDPDAKIKAFAAHFWQYTDAKKFEVIPTKWPRIFPLKIGGNVIGSVNIDWGKVTGKLVYANKSDKVSDDEFINAFQAASPEEQFKFTLPLFIIAFHMFEYFPEKLSQAALDLTHEGVVSMRIKHSKNHGVTFIENPTEEAEKLGANEAKRIKQRLGIGRGGARRRRGLAAELDTGLLVHFVDSVRPLWEYITSFFAKHHYDEDCISWVKAKEEFKRLSEGFKLSDELLRRVYRRQNESQPELEPLGLAIEHAREQLGISRAHATVSKHYKAAKREITLGKSASPAA
jgi:hypothetical protein